MTADTDPERPGNAGLRALAASVLEPPLAVVDRTRRFGRATLLWAVTDAAGHRAFVKRHESRRHFERERDALAGWARALDGLVGCGTPDFLATDDEAGALVLAACPGLHVEDEDLDGEARHLAHRLAGRFARALHDLPVDVPSDMATRLEDYVVGILEQSEGFVPREDLARGLALARDPFLYADLEVTHVHMDFSPRNWILDRTGDAPRLQVIDWERSRPEMRLHDFQRMAPDHWARDPGAREAFFAGYGAPLSADDERRLEMLTYLIAIATVPWARTHGDRAFEAYGRRLLAQLGPRL